MGDHISLGQSLIITGFSMMVVFLGLIAISILIGGLQKIGGEKKVETDKTTNSSQKKEKLIETDQVDMVNNVDIVDDEELVAVISAAIAASMGVSIPELNIKSIRRTPETTNAWTVTGRQEQISGKL